MENHHFSWENSLFLWPFSIAILTSPEGNWCTIWEISWEDVHFFTFFLTPRNKSSHEYRRLVSFSPQSGMLTTWHCGFPVTVRVCPWFSSTPLVHWYRARPKGVTIDRFSGAKPWLARDLLWFWASGGIEVLNRWAFFVVPNDSGLD